MGSSLVPALLILCKIMVVSCRVFNCPMEFWFN